MLLNNRTDAPAETMGSIANMKKTMQTSAGTSAGLAPVVRTSQLVLAFWSTNFAYLIDGVLL
jgi:hypothetical protein